MASNIPVRRTTRLTRNNNITKDNENANARPSRVTTRAKANGEDPVKPTTRAAAAAAAAASSKMKGKATAVDETAAVLPAKRKRGALVEVVAPADRNKPKTRASTATGKGKQVFDAVVVSTAKPVVQKTVITRATRTTTTKVATTSKSTVVAVEDAMDVDRSVATRASSSRKTRVPIVHDEAEASRAHKKRHIEEIEKQQRLQDESQLEADAIAAQLAEAEDEWEEAPVLELEADPEGTMWDDIDAEDDDDPAMVSEYVAETFQYLKELEASSLPSATYMESQKEIDWSTRSVLVDWLVQIHARCRLLPETLFLCTNIMDRFLSARNVSLNKFQLVGITCFFIAAKYEETFAPSLEELKVLSDNQYTDVEILKAERFVLKTVDWNLSYPNAIHYLRRCSKADDSEVRARTVGKYLLEIGCIEWRLVATPPSLLAAAALWLARLVLGREDWTPNLAHYSSYRESEVIPIANLMLNFILKPVQYHGFHKKYASKKFYKSSIYMRQWALNRWNEGDRIDLAALLPALKHDIRVDRAASAAEAEAAAQEQQAENGVVEV